MFKVSQPMSLLSQSDRRTENVHHCSTV